MTVPEPAIAGDERETLAGFLDYYRAVIVDKAGGLTADQRNRTLGPSSLTLGGLVHHLALVEQWWFRVAFAGEEYTLPVDRVDWESDPDWDFSVAAEMDPSVVLDRYHRSCEDSRRIVNEAESLDQLSARATRDGERWSLRWILVHMIEETARHAGHADLIRESIDGEVGDFRKVD
jgi:hypothetical protein